jgi:hypothetical protein
MATFSMGEAVGAGFGLIAKKPLSVLAWGLAYLILGVAPVVGMFAFIGQDLIGAFHGAGNAGPDSWAFGPGLGAGPQFDFGRMWRFQSRFLMFQPVLLLTGLAARAVLSGAIFRAVLEPQNRGFAYLRLGKRELWLGLLILAMGILMVLLMVALAGVTAAVCIAIVAALKAANVPAVWGGLAAGICIAAATVAFIHVCLRFSLAAPMTFAAGEFRLFESWAITKGQTLKLFGLGLVLMVAVIAVTMVVQALVIALTFGVLGLTSLNHEAVEAFFRNPPQNWVSVAAPWMAGGAVLAAFLTAAFSAIMLAPWAVVYRSLSGGGDEPPATSAAPLWPEDHGGEHGGHDAAPAAGHGDDHAPDLSHEPGHDDGHGSGAEDHAAPEGDHDDHSKPDPSAGHH